MNERISRLRNNTVSGEHHKYRRNTILDPSPYRKGELYTRDAKRLACHLNAEQPVITGDEVIVLTRTLPEQPDILSSDELKEIK
jgi:hypothetical protein